MFQYRVSALFCFVLLVSIVFAFVSSFWGTYSSQHRQYEKERLVLIELADRYGAEFSVSESEDSTGKISTSSAIIPAFRFDPWKPSDDVGGPFIIRYLRIDGIKVDERVWEDILSLSSVERLSFWNCELTKAIPERLSQNSPTDLSIEFSQMSQGLLESLKQLRSVRVLKLSSVETFEVDEALSGMQELKVLELQNVAVSEKTLKSFVLC